MADLDTFRDRGILRDTFVTRPVLILGGLGVVVLSLAAVCVLAPLVLGRRLGQRRAIRTEWPFYTYFAGIGLGFMLVEIAQLQRLSLYLGHPTYGLAVSLFSVLLFSGLGSLAVGRLLERLRSPAPVMVALALVVVVAGLATTEVLSATDGSTTPVRIAIAVALLAPLAFMMGMPFAVGMEAANARPGTPTAFLWGINGAASVCASVLAVVLSLLFGISTAFWLGVVAYGIAVVSIAVVVVRRPVTRPDGDPPVVVEPALVG
jgi:hypothetical protein